MDRKPKIIANISNRHVHLAPAELEKLFGPGYKLTKTKDLMQPGEHACDETVKIKGPKGEIDKVRVLGPLRTATQVEISMGDSIRIGAAAPVRSSGDVKGSAPVTVTGPKGTVDLAEGLIVAKRHVHMTPADAAVFGVKDNDIVSVRCGGPRGLVFNNVTARVSDKMALECHLDIEEANAAGVRNGDLVEIV